MFVDIFRMKTLRRRIVILMLVVVGALLWMLPGQPAAWAFEERAAESFDTSLLRTHNEISGRAVRDVSEMCSQEYRVAFARHMADLEAARRAADRELVVMSICRFAAACCLLIVSAHVVCRIERLPRIDRAVLSLWRRVTSSSVVSTGTTAVKLG